MPRRIPLSRAAQLAGVKRAELQQHIRDGDIPSFDGTVEVADLLRLYPDVQMQDNTQLERLARIMDNAVAKTPHSDERKLPEARVLAARLNSLAQELVEVRAENRWYETLLASLDEQLDTADDVSSVRSWLDQALQQREQLDPVSRQVLTQAHLLRTVAATVSLAGTELDFTVEGSESILQAGLAAGVPLEFGCSDGACGLCRAQIISGEITRCREQEYSLSEAEKAQGYFLMCCNTAVSDINIDAQVALGPDEMPQQRLSAKVKKLSPLNDEVMLLQLRMPRTQRLRFLAGQAVRLTIDDYSEVLSIASCPCDETRLEFHLPIHDDTPLAQAIAQKVLKSGKELLVEGPQGQFVLDDGSERPIVFVCVDAGFAPVKSLVEHAMQLEHASQLTVFWISNQLSQPYLENLCRAWRDAVDGFNSECMFNDETNQHSTAYRENAEALMRAILRHYPAITDYDLYLAADSAFLEVSKALLNSIGFPAGQLHCEVIPH